MGAKACRAIEVIVRRLRRSSLSLWRWPVAVDNRLVPLDDFSSRAYPSLSTTNLLLCGLRGSGKTAIMYSLKLGTFIPTIPTVDLIYESFENPVLGSAGKLAFWEAGQDHSITSLPGWHHYKNMADCVLFVIDSGDRRHLSEAREELVSLMHDEHFQTKKSKFLVFANKQDVVGALKPDKIDSFLDLPRGMKSRVFVVGCSALNGAGILEGIKWLTETNGCRASNAFTL